MKRSCRKRLDGHNKRRRKPQPGSTSPGSLFPNHQGLNYDRNFLFCSLDSTHGASWIILSGGCREQQVLDVSSSTPNTKRRTQLACDIYHSPSPPCRRQPTTVVCLFLRQPRREAAPSPATWQHCLRQDNNGTTHTPAIPQDRKQRQQQQDPLSRRLCSLSSVINSKSRRRRRHGPNAACRKDPRAPSASGFFSSLQPPRSICQLSSFKLRFANRVLLLGV